MLKHWAFVGLFVVLTGACKKDDGCPVARSKAAAVVVDSEGPLRNDLEEAEAKAKDVELRVARVKKEQSALEQQLQAIEESMGCNAHADCCPRMGRYSRAQKAKVYETGRGLSSLEVPLLVAGVTEPVSNHVGMGEQLALFTAGETIEWCATMRVTMKQARERLPERWAMEKEELEKEAATVQKAISSTKRQIAAIGSWADALRKQTKATVDPELDGSGYFLSARSSMQAYQNACL